jgi:hypothetical protein
MPDIDEKVASGSGGLDRGRNKLHLLFHDAPVIQAA